MLQNAKAKAALLCGISVVVRAVCRTNDARLIFNYFLELL